MPDTMEQFNAMRMSARADDARMRKDNIKALIGLITLFVVAAILLQVGATVVDSFFEQLSNSTTVHHSYTSTR